MKYYIDINEKNVFSIVNFEYTTNEYEFEITKEQYNEYFKKINDFYIPNIEIINEQVNITYYLTDDGAYKLEQRKTNTLRNKRIPLLSAFDKYKTNVNYGIVVEDEETKGRIVSWYSDLLNLVESAFKEENVPNEIKYYLK